MNKNIVTILLCFLFFLPCRDAVGIEINLTKKDVADAIKKGKEQSSNVTNYLNQRYGFGEEGVFEENGVIRTKWYKLVMFSGLLTVKGKELTEQERKRIMASNDLQIDIHTFGNKIDFAKDYKIHLVQKGKIIEPENISANHVAYHPKKKIVAPGFPRYRATVRAFFTYNKIDPNEKAEIALVKNKKKVLFEVNFADYK